MSQPFPSYAQEETAPQENIQQVQESEPVQKAEEEKNVPDTVDGAEAPAQEEGNKDVSQNEKQIDVTKPVIEKIEFPQQGQTLKIGETVEIYIYAYDAESGIERVEVELQNNNQWKYMDVSYNEEKQCYVGKWVVEKTVNEKTSIAQIKVVDNNMNYVQLSYYGDDAEYWFFQDKQETDIKIREFNLKPENVALTVSEINTLEMSLEADAPEDITTMSAYFSAEDGSDYRFTLSREAGTDIFSWDQDGYTYSSGTSEKRKEYVLKYVSVERFGGDLHISVDNADSCRFAVEYSEVDTADKENPQIKDINVDKNGQTVHAGDKINIAIKAVDNGVLEPEGYIYMNPAAEIDISNFYVPISYNEADGYYHGVFEITDDTYPCEWYLSYICIRDEAGNTSSMYDLDPNFFNSYPYYVNVYHGDTFVDPVRDITISFLTKNDHNNYWNNVEVEKKENVGRRFTLKDIGITLPEVNSEVCGVQQTGWITGDGQPLSEDTVLYNKGYLSIYADYDNKCIVTIQYGYVDRQENWNYEVKTQAVEQGTTWGEVIKSNITYKPEGMSDLHNFDKWEYSFYYGIGTDEDTVVKPADNVQLSMTAVYHNEKIVVVNKSYFDEKGYRTGNDYSKAVAVSETATVEDIRKMAGESEVPKMYPGLRFNKWDISITGNDMAGDPNQLKPVSYLYMNAVYDNHIIRYFIDPIFAQDKVGEFTEERLEALFCQVAEKGDEIVLPHSFEGYKDVKYKYKDTDEEKFVVDRNMEFYGYGTKDQEVNPPVPDPTPDPEPTPNEEIKLPEETVNKVVEMINNTPQGQEIPIDMGSATVVPEEILEAAKGKDIDISLSMGDYTWTINGQDIKAVNLKDINLEVKVDAGQIPSQTIEALAGDNPVKQLSLTHNGDFGFKASLTVNVGPENADKYGNLYYYDSDGKLVFINAGKVNEDGTVSLDFSHASEYVLVMNDKKMNQDDVPDNSQGGGNKPSDPDKDTNPNPDTNGNKNNGTNGTKTVNSVKTGDDMNAAPFLVILIMAAAAVAACVVRMKRKVK